MGKGVAPVSVRGGALAGVLLSCLCELSAEGSGCRSLCHTLTFIHLVVQSFVPQTFTEYLLGDSHLACCWAFRSKMTPTQGPSQDMCWAQRGRARVTSPKHQHTLEWVSQRPRWGPCLVSPAPEGIPGCTHSVPPTGMPTRVLTHAHPCMPLPSLQRGFLLQVSALFSVSWSGNCWVSHCHPPTTVLSRRREVLRCTGCLVAWQSCQ